MRRLGKWLETSRRWVHSHEWIGWPAGVFVVLVPVVLAIYPSLADRIGAWRHALAAITLIAAGLVVWTAVHHQARVARYIGEDIGQRDLVQFVSAIKLIKSQLEPRSFNEPLSPECDVRLFLYDKTTRRLSTTIAPPGHQSRASWEPGRGATGRAWQENRQVVQRGDEVLAGLTEGERERYRGITAVVATPVQNIRGRRIAILTVGTRGDPEVLVGPAALASMAVQAQSVSRIVIDIWRVARD